MPRKFLSRRAFIIGTIGTMSYLYFGYKSVAVKHYTIQITNLPDEFNSFTILHLSDLHSKEYGSNQSSLLKLIRCEKFDMVALTGDFIDKRNPQVEPLNSLITGLVDKPIFFVPGNHEWSTQYYMRDNLVSQGVKVLDNNAIKYEKGKSHIWIVGVDDPYLGRDQLEKAMIDIADDCPKILLAHAPNIFNKAITSKIDLTLVGHTHGGQIRLPFIGAIVAPGQGLFPEYDYGLFKSGTGSMIINGGLGESVLPIRFYNRPEIVFIKLKPILHSN